MATTNKHPDAAAWDQWIESPTGRGCRDGTVSGIYLENRLNAAFKAGVAHGEKRPEQAERRGDRLVREFEAMAILLQLRAIQGAQGTPVPAATPPAAAPGKPAAAPRRRTAGHRGAGKRGSPAGRRGK